MSTSSSKTFGQQRLLSLLAGVSVCVALGAVAYMAIIPATRPLPQQFAAAFTLGWPIAVSATLVLLWPVQILLRKLEFSMPLGLVAVLALAALTSAIASVITAIAVGDNFWLLFMMFLPAAVVSGAGGLLVGALFERLGVWLCCLLLGIASVCWIASICVLTLS